MKAVMTYYGQDFVDPGILGNAGITLELKMCKMDDEDEIIAAARDATAILAPGIQKFSKRVLQHLEQCRILAVTGIGYDAVDLDAATQLGICVANNPFYCTHELAEHALACILSFARRLSPLESALRAGRWTRMGSADIRQVASPIRRFSSSTIGIIGLGNAGQALARKARGLGFRVIAYARRPAAVRGIAGELGIELLSLERLLSESDFVSLHAALTQENRGMIGSGQLQMMKPTAYIINTARGGLIDQPALVRALSEGVIAGAALDVMEQEPISMDDELLQLENVILTPHSAYASVEAQNELRRYPFEEVMRVLKGQWPKALLNTTVKERYIAKWGPMS